MISTTIFPGRFVQGYDTMKRLGEEMARFGKKGLLICDSFVLEKIIPNSHEGCRCLWKEQERYRLTVEDGNRQGILSGFYLKEQEE